VRSWSVEVALNGPTDGPSNISYTPGFMAYGVKWGFTCMDIEAPPREDPAEGDDFNPDQEPAAERIEIYQLNPTFFAVCRDVSEWWWESTVRDAFGIFEEINNHLPVDGWVADCARRLEIYTPEFGTNGPDLDVLLSLDLSELPSIYTHARENMLSYFLYHTPVEPLHVPIGRTYGQGGIRTMCNEVVEILESTGLDHPAHRIERWWNHAWLSTVVEKLSDPNNRVPWVDVRLDEED